MRHILMLGLLASMTAACGGSVVVDDQKPTGTDDLDAGAQTPGTDQPDGAGPPDAPNQPDPPDPQCDLEGTLETMPGPCQPDRLECGESCGSCESGKTCSMQRCYSTLGPSASFVPPLMRHLDGRPEGQRCRVAQDGVLEHVEAAIWTDGATTVTMEVYRSCDDEMVKAAEVSLPASAFPLYDGIHGEMRTTTFSLDPPVKVRGGDSVDVIFHAEGGTPMDFAVSGIHMTDVEPWCSFISHPGYEEDPGWDFMARMYVH